MRNASAALRTFDGSMVEFEKCDDYSSRHSSSGMCFLDRVHCKVQFGAAAVRALGSWGLGSRRSKPSPEGGERERDREAGGWGGREENETDREGPCLTVGAYINQKQRLLRCLSHILGNAFGTPGKAMLRPVFGPPPNVPNTRHPYVTMGSFLWIASG